MTVLISAEQGLLYAARGEFKYLPGLTVGFVALGTPFSGTKMLSLADKVAQVMVLAGSHRGIIEDLAFGSTTLRDKLREFCTLEDTKSIPMYCFFEFYKSDYGRRFGIPGLFQGMVCINKSEYK